MEQPITGKMAKQLRIERGLTQAVFWGAVGVAQSVGARWEQRETIPEPLRILLAATYLNGEKPKAPPTVAAVRKAQRAIDMATKSLREARLMLEGL